MDVAAYQWQVLLCAVILGTISAAWYQLLRGGRHLIRSRWAWIVLDLLFWYGMFFILRFLFEYGCNGNIRIYPLIGLIVGVGLYYMGIGLIFTVIGRFLQRRLLMIAYRLHVWYNKIHKP